MAIFDKFAVGPTSRAGEKEKKEGEGDFTVYEDVMEGYMHTSESYDSALWVKEERQILYNQYEYAHGCQGPGQIARYQNERKHLRY